MDKQTNTCHKEELKTQIASQSASLEPTGFQPVKLVSFSDVEQSFGLWFNDKNLLSKSLLFIHLLYFFLAEIRSFEYFCDNDPIAYL